MNKDVLGYIIVSGIFFSIGLVFLDTSPASTCKPNPNYWRDYGHYDVVPREICEYNISTIFVSGVLMILGGILMGFIGLCDYCKIKYELDLKRNSDACKHYNDYQESQSCRSVKEMPEK